jgi:uncharacterized protein
LKIDVRGLLGSPGEQREFEFTVQAPPVGAGGQEIRFEPARVRMTLTSTVRGVLALGAVTSAARMACSRCLADCVHPIEEGFEHLFLEPGPDLAQGQQQARQRREAPRDDRDVEDDEDDLDVSAIYGGEIDLGPVLAAVLDLALPMKPLCRPECRGLCPVCGHSLNEGECQCRLDNTDPRLLGLARVLRQDDQASGQDGARTEERKE